MGTTGRNSSRSLTISLHFAHVLNFNRNFFFQFIMNFHCLEIYHLISQERERVEEWKEEEEEKKRRREGGVGKGDGGGGGERGGRK